MKKMIGIIALIIGCFVLVVGMSVKSTNDKKEKSVYDKKDLKKSTVDLIGNEYYENIILPGALEKKLQNKESMFVYFFSPECVYCVDMTPILMSVGKELGVHIDQYNLLEYEEGYEKYGIDGTPLLIRYEEGREVDRMSGLRPYVEAKNFLLEYMNKASYLQ